MVTMIVRTVLLAVALRLALILLVAPNLQRVFNSDSYEFDALARGLIEHGQFSRSEVAPFAPEIARTPLFPAISAVLYALFGPRYVVVLLFNVVLAGAMTWFLARFTGPPGAVAALLYAVDPTSIIYSSLFVAETLVSALILTGVILLARGLDANGRATVWYFAASGLLLGLAVLAKPVATYLPALLLATAFLRRGRNAMRAALAFVVLWSLAVGPWLLRNRLAAGVFTISAIQETNLLYWNVAFLEGRRNRTGYRAAQAALRAELERRAGAPEDTLPPSLRLREQRRLAIERIGAHPFAYAWLHVRGAALTLFDPGRLDISRLLGGIDWDTSLLGELSASGIRGLWRALRAQSPAILLPMAVIALWSLSLVAAAAVGCWRQWPWSRAPALPTIFLLTILYLALIGGPIGNARFRVPLLPYLAWFAAAGLARRSIPQPAR